jgi:hypothetical protein
MMTLIMIRLPVSCFSQPVALRVNIAVFFKFVAFITTTPNLNQSQAQATAFV